MKLIALHNESTCKLILCLIRLIILIVRETCSWHNHADSVSVTGNAPEVIIAHSPPERIKLAVLSALFLITAPMKQVYA
ncbi:hypothetical protein ES708_05765 [subsurface metagenome]